MKKATKRFPLYDRINHFDLRSDIENDLVGVLVPVGKIHDSPETWAIELHGPSGWIDEYLYDSKSEYEQDAETIS